MNRKRILLCILCSVLLLFSIAALTAYAHPGRTDSNGGHYISGTSSYHYHHGYPKHNHFDVDCDDIIDCPYDFSIETQSIKKAAYETALLEAIIITLLLVFLTFSCRSNSRKNKEIELLKESLESHRNTHAKLKNDLSNLSYLAVKVAPPENRSAIDLFCKTYGVNDPGIPPDISFIDGFIPVKGHVSKDMPYGEFTVFISSSGVKYHRNRYCAKVPTNPVHLYKTGFRCSACLRCAKDLSNIPPEWYKHIQEIMSNNK